MGCCLNQEDTTKHNEIILIDTNSNKRIKLDTKTHKKKSYQNINVLKAKMSLKSNIILPNQRKLSMGRESLGLRHKSVSYLSPLKTMLVNNSNKDEKDNEDKDCQSDDEPLKKRASMHISKFLFVFQDGASQEKHKPFSNYNQNKKSKKKKYKQQYQSPYEGEIDLALVYPQLYCSPINELSTS